jgi:DNA-binding NarL/FixJ family response regulator
MDLGLPGRSGIEGIARVHSIAPATNVIVLTIHAEEERVVDAIAAGATGYLLKPSHPAQILDAIRQVRQGAAPINPYIARKLLARFARQAPARPSGSGYHLTARETEVLELLVDGLTMEQIAARLGASTHTIDNHVRHIYQKLHVRNRARAVAKAVREDLV